MAVNDPKGAAAKVTTAGQAKRLWQRIDDESGERSTDVAWLSDAAEAQRELEERFLSEQMSPESSGDDSGGASAPRSGPRTPSGKRPGGRKAGGGSSRRGGKKPRAGRRARSIGSSLPGFSAGGPLLTSILWGTLALVILYVLIRAAEVLKQGSSPLDLFATGLQTGLSVLVAPVDPLAPRATRKQSAVSNSADLRQVLVAGVPLANAAPRSASSSSSRRPTQTTTTR
jgi:hypothetical protein